MWDAGSHGPCALVWMCCHSCSEGSEETIFDRQVWDRFGLAALGFRDWESRQKVLQIKSRGWSPSPNYPGCSHLPGDTQCGAICKLQLFLPNRNSLSSMRGHNTQGIKTIFATVFDRHGKG